MRLQNIFSIHSCRVLYRPRWSREWPVNLWSTITAERIGLESQLKHPWIQETARNRMRMTKAYLCIWNFWEKSIFVLLPYWNFSKIRSQCEKTHSASRLAYPIRFLRVVDRRNTRQQDPFEKSRFWSFRGGKFGGPKAQVGKIDFYITVWGRENPTVVLVRYWTA